MKNLLKRIASFAEHPLVVPLILLAVTFLAYGLFFWRLGFYWDDQPISWIRYQLGVEATTRYFSDSRPVWALLYQISGFLLPQKPALWQLFGMFWRWAGVYVFWLVMTGLFPKRKEIAFFLSLLLLLYPGFNQQWVSYVYSHFFIVLFFLLFSWHLMLRGKTLPAMIFSALNLVMFEYFFMLEFMRPFILLMSIREETLTLRERFVKVFKAWIPYLAVILFAVLYRALVYTHPGFGYSLTEEVARAPIATLTQLVQHILSSLWTAAVGAWLQVFQFPTPAVNGVRTTVLYLFVVLIGGALVFLKRLSGETTEAAKKQDTYWLIGLGAVMLFLGGVPYWVTNLPVTLGFPANRALLSFMFGACFLLLGLLDLLPPRIRYAAAVLLVSLSAGRQFLWSVEYLRDWESQKNLFWQMTWRAPGIEPGTIVLMNEELEFNADNSLSAPLNWIYAPGTRTRQVGYILLYPTNRLGASLPALEPGLPIRYDFLAASFEGNTSHALAFYYNPPACLRLLEPDLDAENRLIPAESLMREASALSNADRITAVQQAVMPPLYFPEPPHGWCYYFQKADLARQLGDWEEVARLGDAAFQLDDYPNDPIERFVFIEGYAHVGRWEDALEYSKVSYKISKEYVGPLLCQLWKRIEAETASSQERDALSQSKRSEAIAEARQRFACSTP
ncbi:MAG: hypothetical protein ACOYYF_06730 [Chloroflexota bacterium]|nr:hypothetical protein [Chloroflexota bacterium]MBI5704658.1 hypothetical protein [Chloroflexota bacterium]